MPAPDAAPPSRLPPIGAPPPSRRSRWSRLRGRLRPPRTLRITPVGRTYLIVTLGVGLGALNTGNNLLYLVLGLLLSLIVVSGVLSERVLRGVRVRRIGAEAAFATEPFAFRWALSRPRGHGFALEVSEVHPGLEGTGVLAHLPPGEEVVVRGTLLARRRGPHRLEAVRLTTLFPLGLFAKSRVVEVEGTLVVYPRRIPPPRQPEQAPVGGEGATHPTHLGGGTGDLAGLVALREGEDARRIHWLRSASLGSWVRIEREREERRTYVLRTQAKAASPKLERECEVLAAAAHQLLAQGHEVGLEAEPTKLRPSGGPAQERRILRALAYAGFEAGGEG